MTEQIVKMRRRVDLSTLTSATEYALIPASDVGVGQYDFIRVRSITCSNGVSAGVGAPGTNRVDLLAKGLEGDNQYESFFTQYVAVVASGIAVNTQAIHFGDKGYDLRRGERILIEVTLGGAGAATLGFIDVIVELVKNNEEPAWEKEKSSCGFIDRLVGSC